MESLRCLLTPVSLWSFPDLLMKNGNLLALCAFRCPHLGLSGDGSWGGSCSISLVVGAFCTLGGCRRGEPSSRSHKIHHRLLSSVALCATVPGSVPFPPSSLQEHLLASPAPSGAVGRGAAAVGVTQGAFSREPPGHWS